MQKSETKQFPMKTVLIKDGKYPITKTLQLPLNVGLFCEPNAILQAKVIPIVKGNSNHNIFCSNCEALLAENIEISQIKLNVECSCGNLKTFGTLNGV